MSAAWCARRSSSNFSRRSRLASPTTRPPTRPACRNSIEEVVRQQVEAGIDIVSDGEFSKGRNWAFYIHDRLSGVATRAATAEELADPMASASGGQDRAAFPEFYAEYDRVSGLGARLGKRFVGQRPPHLFGHAGQARHRQSQGGGRQGQGRRRIPAGGGAGKRAARRQERALSRREEPAVRARRLPAPGIPGHHRCRPLRADRRRLPALHARADGPADERGAVSRLGADAHRRAQPCAQGHSARALALSHLLGQLERTARLRRADEGHRRPAAAGERRPLQLRGRQPAPRARMDGVAEREAAARQGAHSRRHQPRHQHRRASRTGGAAHRPPRQYRRPRACHGRHRLRLCAESVCAACAPLDHVGEAALAGGRRAGSPRAQLWRKAA